MTKEIHPLEESFIRDMVDPTGSLPYTVLVPAQEQAYGDQGNLKTRSSRYVVLDIEGGEAGQATIVHTPYKEHYFTRLEVAAKGRESQMDLAAYVLAAEHFAVTQQETFRSDLLVERPEAVALWNVLVERGVATVIKSFTPFEAVRHAKSTHLFVGHVEVPPAV